MIASVVVPTRDRHQDLARCLEALQRQTFGGELEVIVVDDGSRTPVRAAGVRLLRCNGRGPATARNSGLQFAAGSIVLFTDDDTVPDPVWVETAWRFLHENPRHVGVEGPILSPPFDYLYEHSVDNGTPGAYWTCNIAYRTEVLRELGGFRETFTSPHCEDLDLGFSALKHGPIGFA